MFVTRKRGTSVIGRGFLVVGLVATMFAFGLGHPRSASAVTVATTGMVSPAQVVCGLGSGNPAIRVYSPMVYASPAMPNGQYVQWKPVVQHWAGDIGWHDVAGIGGWSAWSLATSGTTPVWNYQILRVPGHYFANDFYRVVYEVHWYSASGTSTKRVVNQNQTMYSPSALYGAYCEYDW